METPKSPIGRYISRKAYDSHETAPVPWLVASSVLTKRLTCVAASPMVPGPISRSTRRSPGSRKSRTKRYRNPSRHSGGHCTSTWSAPPSSAAIAIAMMGARPTDGISGTRTNAQTIVAMLNIAGASAGTKKWCSELSMPITAAATATMGRNGSIIRVSRIVSSSLPGTRL